MADPDRERVKEVFTRIVEAPAEKRQALLEQWCGGDRTLRDRVEALLRADDQAGEGDSGFLSAPALAGAAGIAREALANTAEPVGEVGSYILVGKLGEGGMGTVYEARQRSPDRAIALKLIRAGAATPALQRRLRREALALGRLEHAGIARVYEAGSAPVTYSDGSTTTVPFIAMELVRGETLGRHAAQRRLDDRARLRLVAAIADAVEFAHQKGVVHRDLKPGNILVTEDGDPKVLDFGVARLTDLETGSSLAQTMQGQLVGTLAYMSPEQIAGDPNDVDTRADVYALGVIAYELLSGVPPLDVGSTSLAQAARMITETDPRPLGSAVPRLSGDVATIVATAMSKAREQRYQSAGELACDIRRFLANEPITARAPSPLYVARKFAQRHRTLVAAAAGIALTLVAGTIVSGVLAVRASQARDLAVRETARAQSSATFMREMLQSVTPGVARGMDTELLSKILDDTAGRLDDGELSDEPLVEAEMRVVVGRTYQKIAQYDRAIAMLERGAALYTEAGSVMGSKTRHDVSAVLIEIGRFDRAETLLLELEAHCEQTGDIELWEIDATLGALYNQQGRYAESIPRMRRAIDGRIERYGEDSINAASAMTSMAGPLMELGRLDEAVALYERAAEIVELRAGPDHPNLAQALNNLAIAYTRAGRNEEAVSTITRALELQRGAYASDHPAVGMTTHTLGGLLQEEGRLEEAEEHYREALRIFRATLPPEHWFIAQAGLTVGQCMAERGAFEEAAAIMHESYRMLADTLGAENRRTRDVAAAVAGFYASWHESAPAPGLEAEQARWRRLAGADDEPEG